MTRCFISNRCCWSAGRQAWATGRFWAGSFKRIRKSISKYWRQRNAARCFSAVYIRSECMRVSIIPAWKNTRSTHWKISYRKKIRSCIKKLCRRRSTITRRWSAVWWQIRRTLRRRGNICGETVWFLNCIPMTKSLGMDFWMDAIRFEGW